MIKRRLILRSLEDRLVPTVGDLLHTLTPQSGAIEFGCSVAASSQYAVVGAVGTNDNGSSSGSAYVYNAVTGAFIRTLANPAPSASDEFGYSVAVAGDDIVVGAPYDDTDGADVGIAYVFSASTGNLLATLHNPTPTPGSAVFETFGNAVAISGNTVYVGAYLDSVDGPQSGGVYSFNATTGQSIARIMPPDPGGGDYFGYSLAISGDLLAVGAALDDASGPGPNANSGSVHLYSISTGNFLRTIPNPGPAPAASDFFGSSVGLSGSTLVVGSGNHDTGGTDTGTAYVFNANTGALIQTLNNPTPANGDQFGWGVAVSANTVIVGAPSDNTGAADSGSAYAFDAQTGALLATINNPFPFNLANFGFAVAAYGPRLYAGAYVVGSEYIFEGRSAPPPDAVDDSATVPEDSVSTRIDVLVNDLTSDVLSVTQVTQPIHGTVTISADGLAVEYTPTADYNGTDTFTYTVTDLWGSDTATVSMTVTPVNDPPDAVDDQAELGFNAGPTAVPVLDNDTDVPDTGETLTITQVTQGVHGTVVITGGGTGLSYASNTGFFGTDSFTYTISDGNGGTDTATVSITVDPPPDFPPDAVDDIATVAPDLGAQAIGVLDNDTDPDNDTLTIIAVTQGMHGTVTITGGGTALTYAPSAGYTGADFFSYTVSDGRGGTDTANVAISVQEPPNHPPDAVDDTAILNEDAGAQTIDVLANDADQDTGDTLTVTAVTQGQHGTVAIAGGGSSITYTPAPNFAGTDSFLYAVSDGNGGTDYAAVNVTVNNDVADRLEVVTSGGTVVFTEGNAPVAIDPGVRVSNINVGLKKAQVKITSGYVRGRDVLVFPATPGFKGSFNRLTGVLTITGSGSAAAYQLALRGVLFRNSSPSPIAGVRTVSFTVSDALGTGDPATRKVRVVEVNTPPVLTLTAPTAVYKENKPAVALASTLVVKDLDSTILAGATAAITAGFTAGQDVLSVTVKPGITGSYDPGTGVLTLTGSAPRATYQAVLRTIKYRNSSDGPSPVSRTVSFTASDGASTSAPATRIVSVVPVNDAPVLDTAPNPSLPDVPKGNSNPAGTTVATLLGTAVTDPDRGALQGIAITGLTGTGFGTWQFSTDGGANWLTIGTVSPLNALLLRSIDMLRFVPSGVFTGQAGISYRAWDQTVGSAGSTMAVGTGGGTSAFSLATEMATVNVI